MIEDQNFNFLDLTFDIGKFIKIHERCLHGKYLSQFASAGYLNQLYGLHIDAFEAIVRECKHINRDVGPLAPEEALNRDSGVQGGDRNALGGSGVKNESSLGLGVINYRYFDM